MCAIKIKIMIFSDIDSFLNCLIDVFIYHLRWIFLETNLIIYGGFRHTLCRAINGDKHFIWRLVIGQQ